MQLEAKTRDSMFKQIALKLLPNGGQMRMRLDPPHLGNLDVNMIVEKGTVVQLSLAAERSDVANMLDRHLPDLKQHLHDLGLSVKNAEVTTHDFTGRGERQHHEQGNTDLANGHGDETNQEVDTSAALQQVGYMTQDGLDFWV